MANKGITATITQASTGGNLQRTNSQRIPLEPWIGANVPLLSALRMASPGDALGFAARDTPRYVLSDRRHDQSLADILREAVDVIDQFDDDDRNVVEERPQSSADPHSSSRASRSSHYTAQ